MPQQMHHGRHKFWVFSNNDKAKQAKQRVNKTIQVVNLREKHLREQLHNYIVAEHTMAKLVQIVELAKLKSHNDLIEVNPSSC
jgi:hypothetical protein